MCVREDHSCRRCIVISIHRIDLHRRYLFWGCHTTRGVKQPYTPTEEALGHRGVCPSRQRVGQLIGSNGRYDVSTQCISLTYLCFTG